ncbi:DUF3373 family protein [uncultured Desulfuromusa sp.]|uniref:DUF3373 family protein n=1 Tax=uncultured Desulfuromusa sp. TaxID=219183 RepID=UPI002AA63AAD|nr:DUF3373 family protein [uncultured Desulfuromusa sp.]
MNKFIVLLIVSVLGLPSFSIAAPNNDSAPWVNSETLALHGEFILSAVSTDTDDYNNVGYGAQLRLGMEKTFADNIALGGQLYAFKYFGEFDTTFEKTALDTIRADRIYLKWWDIAASNVHLSIGRRPFSSASPTNISSGDRQVGIPYGDFSDFNVDGVVVGYNLSPLTGIAGMDISLCYGEGIDSEWGNGTRFKDKNLADAQLGGIKFALYHDDKTLLQFSLFRAMDMTDGVDGVFAYPGQYAALFAPSMYTDLPKFSPISFVPGYRSPTVIGDINLAAFGFRREEDNGFVWFGSLAWTQLVPNGEAGMFGGLGTDAVYEAILSDDGSEVYMIPTRAENDDTQNGYGVYIGMQIPVPMGKFGLEYNYGSKYWTPFNQTQDDILGNKLVTRGHAAEAYYLFEINRNAFIKAGAIYYDFEYTGSGSPVGEPQKIDDIKNGSAYSMLPIVDTAWDTYVKIIIEF